jgi:hypothetical protein
MTTPGLLSEDALPPPPTTIEATFCCPWDIAGHGCNWRDHYTAVVADDGRIAVLALTERKRLATLLMTHLQDAHGGYLP